MTVDIRCEIFCRFGPIISGGISDDPVQGNFLITTKGTLIINRVFTPARGTIVEMAYRRGGLVAPFPRMLTVLSSTADPYDRVTTLEVGDPLVLLENRKERRVVEAETDPFEARRAPQPVMASAVLQTCISRLGLQLTGDSYTLQHRYLIDQFDLSEGYVSVLRKLIESESCYGYITRTGQLRIQKLRLDAAGGGPLFDWQDLARIEHLPNRSPLPLRVEVTYNGREAPGAAADDWLPMQDDELGDLEEWNNSLSSIAADAGFVGNGGLPQQDDSSFRNWEYDRVMGSQVTTVVAYQGIGGEAQATFTHIPISETRAQYKRFSVYDSGRRSRVTKEYLDFRLTLTTSSVVAVNGAYAKWALENGQDVINSPVLTTSETTYQYVMAADGPSVTTETTTESISSAQFNGSLGITDYTGIAIGTEPVIASRTITTTYSSISGGSGKTTVARYIAWGLTQEGSQAIASMLQDGASPAQTAAIAIASRPLVFDGLETRTTSNGAQRSKTPGRSNGSDARLYPQSRPSVQELLADQIDPRGNSDKSIVQTFEQPQTVQAVWSSPMDSSEDAADLRVSLPYSPDDWFSGINGGGTTLNRGGATAAAAEYGGMTMALETGSAWGLSIMGDPWRIPTTPLAPLFISQAGSTNFYRMNAQSWAISNNGLAVGADTLLCGAVGSGGGG